MRRLFFAVLVLAALYAGYWVVGSSRVEAVAAGAVARLREEGWRIDYADLSTVGFPSRFDTTVTALDVESPDGAVAYAAEFVQVLALSYRPNQVIVALPERQDLRIGAEAVALDAQGLRASATVALGPDLPLDHAAVESGPATVDAGAAGGVALDGLVGGLRRAGSGAPDAYDLYLDVEGLRAGAGAAGPAQLRLAATVALDRSLDRRLAEAPRLVSLRLDQARLAQGAVALTASGDLAVDGAGFLAGTLRLRVEEWRGALALLEAAGLLVSADAPLLVAALEGLSQGGEDIEVPVTFEGGTVAALGVILAEAPRLR